MIVKKEVLIVRRVIQLKNDVLHVCQINFFDQENCNVHVVMNQVILDWCLIPQKTFFFS